jgi:hypothetical protein
MQQAAIVPDGVLDIQRMYFSGYGLKYKYYAIAI